MNSSVLNTFSSFEYEELKSLLKRPEEDLQKVVSLLKKKIEESKNQLKISEEKYRNLFNNSPLGIFLFDENGNLLEGNTSESNSFSGFPSSFSYGKNFTEIISLLKNSDELLQIFKKRKEDREKGIELKPVELEIVRQDGEKKWLKWQSSTVQLKDQILIQAIVQDITDSKQAEIKLKESEENFRTIAEDSHLAITILQDDLVVYANQRMADLFGYKREDMLKWTPKEYAKTVAEDSFEFVMDQTRKKQIGDPNVIAQYPIHCVKSTGEKFWVDNISTTINYNGRPADLVTIIDTTEKREAEQKLKETERYLSNIFTSIQDGICVLDKDFNIISFNPKIEDWFSYSKPIIGKKCYEVLCNKTELYEDCECLNILKSKEPFCESELYTENNGEIDKIFNVYTYPLYDQETREVKGIIKYMRDITDQKEAEQNLRESEEKFRTITEQSLMGICIAQDNQIKYINQVYADIFGYTIEEMMKWALKDAVKAIHPDDRKFTLEQLAKKQRGDKNVPEYYQYRGIKKSGETIWVENFSKSVEYYRKPADLITLINITDKKKAEQKLKESEEKFRKITEESLLAICIIQDNVIKYVNQEMAQLYGYTVEDMYNWGPGELMKTIAPDSIEVVREQLLKKQVGDPDVIIHYPIQCIRSNGELFWVDNLSKTMMYEGRPADLITQIDITERIKAQQELVKLNQLKSELLRRTSHELKTPLVSIKGFSELLLEVHRDKLDALIISTLNEIKQGCLRLENLIGDILKTAELESGVIELTKSEENLSFLVRVCVNEIKGFSKLRNHKINLDLHEKLITQFEKEQIHQVISNLLNNAVKYTPPSGLIEIKSDIKEDFIILSIKDNGIGFTEEEKTRIFKQFGKIERYGQGLEIIAEGSGFGLFISKKIMELHGGDIWVESEGRNKGSTFYISLPLI